MVHISAFNDVNKASFRLPFSPITRGGATKFSKKESWSHCASIWRMARKECWDERLRGRCQRSFRPRINMAVSSGLCKICRSFISTNASLQSITARTSAKVTCITSFLCNLSIQWLIGIGWFILFLFASLFRPFAVPKKLQKTWLIRSSQRG